MSASAHRLGLVAAALLAGGCSASRQCAIPDAPLPPPAGPPLPARIGVAYPDGLEVDSLPLQLLESGFRFPVGPAAVTAFNRAAAQLFERPVGAIRPVPVAGGPEAVLSFTVDDVRLTPGPFRPEAAEVKATAVLRDARGEVARATATTRGEGQPVHYMGLLHCDAAGSALGLALASAAARLRDELGASPAVAAWVRDPARAAPAPAAAADAPADAPLPTPVQPPPWEQRFRAGVVPRFLELALVHGTGWSGAPGIGRVDGWGWGFRMAWDLGEVASLGLHAEDGYVTVHQTPDPAQPTDSAEHGFIGVEAMVRLRPGKRLRPWIGLTGAWQAVTWDHYVHAVGGWALVGSAGLDVATGGIGWLRLGVSGSTFTAAPTSTLGASGPTPSPGDAGPSAGMRSLWLSLGWVLDLGPPR